MDSPAVIVAMVIVFTWVAVELIGLFGAKFGGRTEKVPPRLPHTGERPPAICICRRPMTRRAVSPAR